MRDFRDAKAMAQTLRAALAAKGFRITVAQSLELIAEAFGAADWNTLSAAIRSEPTGRPDAAPPEGEDGVAAGRLRFSTQLEATLHRAVGLAKARRHEQAMLEHLLLALTDDAEAASVMRACGVDLSGLRARLAGHVDQEPASEAADSGEGPRPSAAFQRVVQRAVIHVQASGRHVVTGAQLLVAIFSEPESKAARFLEEQAMTRVDAVNFMVHGVVKRDRGAAT